MFTCFVGSFFVADIVRCEARFNLGLFAGLGGIFMPVAELLALRMQLLACETHVARRSRLRRRHMEMNALLSCMNNQPACL